MPYAMSVIVSGPSRKLTALSPPHRKLLYTMYKMGLLNGGPHQIRQHCGPDHAAEPPTATRRFTTLWSACPGATGRCCTLL